MSSVHGSSLRLEFVGDVVGREGEGEGGTVRMIRRGSTSRVADSTCMRVYIEEGG